MAEFLKCACPHCEQSIEYPAEGSGQTVPCPTCEKPLVLSPSSPATYISRVRSEQATEKQKEKLRWFGCTLAEGMTKGQASDAIDKCVRDFPEKEQAYYNRPATKEQLTKLRAYSVETRSEIEDPYTYQEAKDFIGEYERKHRDTELARECIISLVARPDFYPSLTFGRVKKAAKALDKTNPGWIERKDNRDLLVKKVVELNSELAARERWPKHGP